MDDARRLRQDLSSSCAQRLILKYSNRTPEVPKFGHNRQGTKALKSTKNTHLRSSSQDSRSDSPRRSPARFLQEQGGIEGILSEAARGVYSRGEKWGVTKAFKDAVSGLQSGTNSPRRAFDSSRWSLDQGKNVADDARHLAARVKALEERNRALGKMLNTAMEDLWKQQKQFEQKKLEMETNALNVAIAKVQFVQVYLEDSSIPLFPDNSTEERGPQGQEDLQSQAITDSKGEADHSLQPGTATRKRSTENLKSDTPSVTPTIVEPNPTPSSSSAKGSSHSAKPAMTNKPSSTTSQSQPASDPPTKGTSVAIDPAANLGPSPFSHSRPSLAQSSFSWMLKDSDDVDGSNTEVPTRLKSSFVSASSFPPAHTPQDTKKKKTTSTSARAKAGFLFGDERSDGPTAESRREGKKGEEVVLGEDGEEGEGFGMGTLRGISEALQGNKYT